MTRCCSATGARHRPHRPISSPAYTAAALATSLSTALASALASAFTRAVASAFAAALAASASLSTALATAALLRSCAAPPASCGPRTSATPRPRLRPGRCSCGFHMYCLDPPLHDVRLPPASRQRRGTPPLHTASSHRPAWRAGPRGRVVLLAVPQGAVRVRVDARLQVPPVRAAGERDGHGPERTREDPRGPERTREDPRCGRAPLARAAGARR